MKLAPKVALLCRGGRVFVGLETGDCEQPALRYPALIEVVHLPAPGPLAGQVGLLTQMVPVALPCPVLPVHAGERLIPLGGEDLAYPVTRDFLPQYLQLVARIEQAAAAPPALSVGRR